MLKERGFALDQFVADIWDEYGGMRPGTEIGPNPYYAAAQSQKNIYPPFVSLAAYREQPRAAKVYSVWRLDAANADLAKRLVYYAMFAETNGLTGRGCFDLQVASLDGVADTGAASGEWDIRKSAEFVRRAGFPVTEDGQHAEFGTAPAPLRCEGAAFYAGWYSLNHYNDAFTWVPGAIGFHLDSASAAEPPRRAKLVGECGYERYHDHQRSSSGTLPGRSRAPGPGVSGPLSGRQCRRRSVAKYPLAEVDDRQHRGSSLSPLPARDWPFQTARSLATDSLH